ncbi:MAG: DUF2232 domain-containing protein [Dongiaceae bacterium]
MQLTPRDLLFILTAGVLSAVCTVAPNGLGFMGGLLFSLAQLPLFLLALSRGLIPALLGCVVAAVVLFFAGMPVAVGFILLAGVPALLLAHLALMSRNDNGKVTWYPAGLIIYGFTILTLFFLLGAQQFWNSENAISLRETFSQTASVMLQQSAPPEMQETMENWVQNLVDIIPGIFLHIWLFITLCVAAIAQGILTRSRSAARPSPDIADIHLPQSLLWILAASLVISLLPMPWSTYGVGGLLVLTVPFCFAGLGYVHRRLGQGENAKKSLGAFYLALLALSLIFGQLIIFLLALVGLIEPWLNRAPIENR